MSTRRLLPLGAVAALAIVATQVASAQSPVAGGGAIPPLKVFGAYATEIEEPWDGVIHAALNAEQDAGRISYSFTDAIGYAGDMERVLREVSEQEQPQVIFGDAFGNEEATRAVAADYPEIAYVFGSGGGPANPNYSVFDNWIHEPAYLAGMLAGGLTKSNVIGVVAAMPIPEVNRLVSAFTAGAQATNSGVDVKVSFINSFFDPATAKEAALAQIGAGADVLYAERAGVIEAAVQEGVLSIGNMSDQQTLGPTSVVTSVTWNMTPTAEYVVDQVAGGTYTAQDLKDFSMVAKGGAALAPINPDIPVPQELLDAVAAKQADIESGLFRVDINEAQPAGSTTASPVP
jgi:basic membrane lipoprotein Med (substrate-binding protein (PBP1-ABC) superfamily)